MPNKKKILAFIGFFIIFLISIFWLISLIIIFIKLNLLIALAIFICFYLINFIFIFDLTIKKRFSKQSKISWLIVLIILPLMGAIYYFLFGFESLNQKNKHLKLKENLSNQQNIEAIATKVSLIEEGSEKFLNILKDIKKAKKIINIQYFIIHDGIIWREIEKSLLEKLKEGVKVNFLLDYFGCIKNKNKNFKKLEEHGAKFIFFNKTSTFVRNGNINYRNHNKFFIIDNNICYTGGMNIGDEYTGLYYKYGYWADLHFRIEGPIVEKLNEIFKSYFLYSLSKKELKKEYFFQNELPVKKIQESDQHLKFEIMNDGPQYKETLFLDKIIELIKNSNKKIILVSGYLILPKKLLNALFDAIERNVEIEILTLQRPDKKTAYFFTNSYISYLTSKKIKVFKAPDIFMHTKAYIFDDLDTTIFGTSNLDFRSFFLHYETNFISKDKNFKEQLLKIYRNQSSKAFLIKDKKRSIFQKILFKIIIFLSPIF